MEVASADTPSSLRRCCALARTLDEFFVVGWEVVAGWMVVEGAVLAAAAAADVASRAASVLCCAAHAVTLLQPLLTEQA